MRSISWSFSAGNDRRHHHRGRNAGLGQRRHRLQPLRRRRGARLHGAGELAVERRHRQRHLGEPACSAMRDRMSMSRITSADLVTMPTGWLARVQHLQHLAHDAVLLLDRLVGVGVGADGDRARLVAGLRQLPLEQLAPHPAWRTAWSRNRGPATGPYRRGSAARSSRRSHARSRDRG